MGAACETCASAGTIQETRTGSVSVPVDKPRNAGICARWQMGQVASEPGASKCHNEAPAATKRTAAMAIVKTVRRSQLPLRDGRLPALSMKRLYAPIWPLFATKFPGGARIAAD